MASMLSMQIKCPICLEDFKNPKSLPCDHIYCQLCVQRHIQTSTGPSLCPECRHPFQSDDLKDCRLLGSVVSAARDNLRAHRARGGTEGCEEGAAGTPGVLLCREHKEGLKLFCLTDKRLVCSICRDSDRHQGHQFRPAPEAAPIFKEELTASVDFVISERIKLHNLKMKQTEEITKTKEKSRAQRARIAAHSALLVRVVQEQERAMMEQVATQEQRALDTMQRHETAIANRLAETDKLMKSLQTGLDTTRPDAFLQWWSDKGLFQVQEMKCKEAEAEGRYKSRTADLNSVPDTFSRGPYESFGPVFTWRNMLRSITDALDVLVTLDPNLKLFLEHKAVHVQRGGAGGGSGSNRGDAFAFYMPRRGEGGGFRDGYQERALHSGRCYWEVQVGREDNWQQGLRVRPSQTPQSPSPPPSLFWGGLFSPLTSSRQDITMELKDKAVVVVRETGEEVHLELPIKPCRIGVYLDSDTRQVTFCNADDTSVIYTVSCGP